MTYEIYIKGCAERNGLAATCAMAVKVNAEYLQKSAIRFEKYIGKSNEYPIIKNKAQYQMELYALAWALSSVQDATASFKVYSNNLPVVTWINQWDVPEDYEDIFKACDILLHYREISAEHIRKDADNETNRLVNKAAEYILGITESKKPYVF